MGRRCLGRRCGWRAVVVNVTVLFLGLHVLHHLGGELVGDFVHRTLHGAPLGVEEAEVEVVQLHTRGWRWEERDVGGEGRGGGGGWAGGGGGSHHNVPRRRGLLRGRGAPEGVVAGVHRRVYRSDISG